MTTGGLAGPGGGVSLGKTPATAPWPEADTDLLISYAGTPFPKGDGAKPNASTSQNRAESQSSNPMDVPSEDQTLKLQDFDAVQGRPRLDNSDGKPRDSTPIGVVEKVKSSESQMGEPRQEICASVSGTDNPPCVLVKGGEELSTDDKRAIASAYHDFIVENDGADLSQHGAVTYGFSDEDAAKVRVASQFIGANLPEGWRNTRIHAGPKDEVGLSSGQAGRTDWQKIEGDAPEEMYIIKINMDWGDHRTNPSGLARTMLHESMHRRDNDGWIFGHNDAHRQLDANARDKLQEYGLAGGGCLPVGGSLWGLIPPAYPGCSE